MTDEYDGGDERKKIADYNKILRMGDKFKNKKFKVKNSMPKNYLFHGKKSFSGESHFLEKSHFPGKKV